MVTSCTGMRMKDPRMDERFGHWNVGNAETAVGFPAFSGRSGPAAYAIGPVIHASARSLVYRATRKTDGVSVVIKTLPDAYRTSDADRIRNEFEILARLNMPGVIQPMELWSLEGRPALVMEWFEGLPLHRE